MLFIDPSSNHPTLPLFRNLTILLLLLILLLLFLLQLLLLRLTATIAINSWHLLYDKCLTLLSILWSLFHLFLTRTLQDRNIYNFHSIDVKTEAVRHWLTCPSLNPGLYNSKMNYLFISINHLFIYSLFLYLRFM